MDFVYEMDVMDHMDEVFCVKCIKTHFCGDSRWSNWLSSMADIEG
jgi:hypothetical protein